MRAVANLVCAVIRWFLTRFSNGIEFVVTIADYGDLAMSEIETGYDLPFWVRERTLAVPSQNPRAGAFALVQLLAGHAQPKRTVILLNVAGRHDDAGARATNAGEYFVYCRLKNGAQVVVTQGPALSWLKDQIVVAYIVPVSQLKTQFRSRTVFRNAVNQLVRGRLDFVGEQLEISTIDDSPVAAIDGAVADGAADNLPGYVEYPDDFGQCKLTFLLRHVIGHLANWGERVRVQLSCGDKTAELEVPFVRGIFDVPAGDEQIVLAPGSSSREHRDQYGQEKKDHAHLELAVRDGSAYRKICKLLRATPSDLRRHPIRVTLSKAVLTHTAPHSRVPAESAVTVG